MEIFPDPQNPAYVANVKGKLCLVRRRPDRDLKSGRKAHYKSPSKDSVKSKNSSSASRRSTSQPALRSSKSSSKHLHASVEDDTEEDIRPKDDPWAVTFDIPYEKVTNLFKKENIEKLREPLKKVGDAFTAANDLFVGDPTTKSVEQDLDEKIVESFDKVADVFTSSLNKTGELFKGSSTTKTAQQEKAEAKVNKVQKRLQKMADEKKEASDEKSKSDKKTNSLPPGYPVQPGIYQYGGRTLALVPKGTTIGAAMGNTGYVGGAYVPGTYGQFPMGGMMMAPPMGMGMGMGAFGGFNSQYDKPVEVTNVNPTVNGSPAWTAQHACAGCGRLRSKKFQQENPLEVGEMPPISYCRKCEKEIKSTDDEDSDNERGRSKHKKHSKVRRTPRSPYKRKSKPRVVVQEFIVKEKHHKKSKKHKKEKDSSEEESKSSVSKDAAAHLHICANCKNPRSKKYQARHPIKKGETPPPGFCGKCQKEETSSEEESDESDESESEEDITSVLSQEGSSATVSSRQYASVPSVDGGMERVVTTTRRHKVSALYSPGRTKRGILTTVQQSRAPAPIKVVEEYSSSSDSADLMPPPPLPQKHKGPHRSKSSNNKVTATNPIGKYLSTLIFGQKTYDSKGDRVIVQHHIPKHADYRSDSEERGRGRDRAASRSHHQRHERRSFYEAPSPLMKETIVTETVPVRRRSTRARSLDPGGRPAMGGRVRGASRHPSKPRKYFYTERGDTVSYDSEDDIEEIARDLYKTTLSDGAPMHAGRRHYQHHHEAQHHGGAGMSHSESFHSTNSGFSEASQRRRRERSQSGHAHVVYTQPAHQEPPRQEPVLQRPPDEVIVTTQRYVFKKPAEPASTTSRISSVHSEEIRHDKHEHGSNASGRRSHTKLITHDDRAEYYPESWSPRDGHGRKMSTSSPSRQVMAARGEARHEHRHQPHYKNHGGDDSSSIAPDAGSFLDTDSNRSQASQKFFYDGTYHSSSSFFSPSTVLKNKLKFGIDKWIDRMQNPIGMIRNKANTNTASISTDRSSDTYTTSSGSYSSVYTGIGSSRGRSHRSGNTTPRAFHSPVLPQVPGSYVSEEEVATTVRTERNRGRGRNRERSPERRNESPRRRMERSRSNYRQPSVSDAPSSSEYDTDSDHATAGHRRSRSNSRDRRPTREGSELTSNDHIERSISKKRRSRRVSFGEADRVHTYSQVSLGSTAPPNMGPSPAPGISTGKLLDEIGEVRELEHRREIARVREEREREMELERREQRHRARREERQEEKMRREREREKDRDYGYKSERD